MTISRPSKRPLVTRVPFIEAPFPDPDYTAQNLSRRLERHWIKIRTAQPATEKPDGDQAHEEAAEPVKLSFSAPQTIRRCAARLIECRQLRKPMGHLPEKRDIQTLKVVLYGVDLVRIPSEHRADEIAAEVHDEFPWLAPATNRLWHAMRRSVRNDEAFKLPPLLLDGPPGIGKSAWSRFFAKLIGIPSVAIDASGESADFGIVGQERGWSKAEPGRPVNLILQTRIGNPLIVIDEIEKAGLARSAKGEAYRLAEAILPLLEPVTARSWSCPFFRLAMDMGWVSWIMTSNDASLLPAPLRSRCVELKLRYLSLQELTAFVVREQARRGLSDDVTAGVIGALEASPRTKRAPSIRTAIRMLELAEQQDEREWRN